MQQWLVLYIDIDTTVLNYSIFGSDSKMASLPGMTYTLLVHGEMGGEYRMKSRINDNSSKEATDILRGFSKNTD